MPDVFFSYAQEDHERVRPLADSAAAAGLDVWWDPKLRIGRDYRAEIEANLDAAKCVVVLWSHKSIRSGWVTQEAERGLERLVPIRIDDVRIPLGFGQLETATVLDTSKGLPQHCLDVIKGVVAGEAPPKEPLPPLTPPALRPTAPWSRWVAAAATIGLLISLGWIVTRPDIDAAVTSTAPVTTTTSPPPPASRLSEIDSRVETIERYLDRFVLLTASKFPSQFYGPIDPNRVTVENNRWKRAIASLGKRKEDCGTRQNVVDVNVCVAQTLADFKEPDPLPPPGRALPIAEKSNKADPIINLDAQEPFPVVPANDRYTAPLTILVKGEWGGNTAGPCADVAVAYVEFQGQGRTFRLWLDDGRQIAAQLTGRDLPARQNYPGGRMEYSDVAVLEGWPQRAALTATFMSTYGTDTTRCGDDLPYVLVWQYDDRFNSSNAYDALGVLKR